MVSLDLGTMCDLDQFTGLYLLSQEAALSSLGCSPSR